MIFRVSLCVLFLVGFWTLLRPTLALLRQAHHPSGCTHQPLARLRPWFCHLDIAPDGGYKPAPMKVEHPLKPAAAAVAGEKAVVEDILNSVYNVLPIKGMRKKKKR
jgi:hypothetical protein